MWTQEVVDHTEIDARFDDRDLVASVGMDQLLQARQVRDDAARTLRDGITPAARTGRGDRHNRHRGVIRPFDERLHILEPLGRDDGCRRKAVLCVPV